MGDDIFMLKDNDLLYYEAEGKCANSNSEIGGPFETF